MSEHEHAEPEQDERAEDVEDLDVPEGQQEDVAGGLIIKVDPAYPHQKES